MSSDLAQDIARQLPYLRRYARALAGSQKVGDGLVRDCLERLLTGTAKLDPSAGVKPPAEEEPEDDTPPPPTPERKIPLKGGRSGGGPLFG